MGNEFVVYVDGNVIYSRAYGTWNDSIYNAFEQAVDEAIRQVPKPFIEVLDLRRWKIGTLDMIGLAVERHKKAITEGRQLHLTIAKKTAMNYLITKNHIYKRTENYEEPHYLQFEDVEQCCTFLESLDYSATHLKALIQELDLMVNIEPVTESN